MSTARNAVRGETTATIAGVEYVLRPTFDALCAIEGRLGASLIDVLRRGALGRPHLRDLSTVLAETSRAGGKQIPAKELGQFILQDMAGAATLVGAVLQGAFPEVSAEEAQALGKEGPAAAPH